MLNFGLSHSKNVAVVTSDQLKALLQNQVTSLADSDMIRMVLHQSLHLTFISIFAIAIFVVVLLGFVPPISIGPTKQIPLEALSPLED